MLDRDERGFRIYGKLKDDYGADVTIKESSAADEHCVWIFIDGGAIRQEVPRIDSPNVGASHLNRDQARQVMYALRRFLGE